MSGNNSREVTPPQTIRWESEKLEIIDQTLLPLELKYINCDTLETSMEAIKMLRVRGAPAIGVFAALALYVEMKRWSSEKGGDLNRFLEALKSTAAKLNSTRPTAVNLANCLNRMEGRTLAADLGSIDELLNFMRSEAEAILAEDIELCRKIGENGAELIPDGARILTHCNAGALATAGLGTALSAIYTAWGQNKDITVFVDETRPLLQGSRITAWEMQQAGIPAFLITDNMAAHIMKTEKIDLIVVGADRIAANGDAANKIGTYGLAILAKHHNIPLYVLAPETTLDLEINSGEEIPIEERGAEEVKIVRGAKIAPDEMAVRNPAFDVTPAELIAGIVTEKNVFKYPYDFRKIYG